MAIKIASNYFKNNFSWVFSNVFNMLYFIELKILVLVEKYYKYVKNKIPNKKSVEHGI